MSDLNDIFKNDIQFESDILLTPTGDISTINGIENVRLALMRRLITSKGSIVHRPEYGVGIKDFQNALSSLSNQLTLATRVKEEFEKDPRVEKVSGVRIKNDKTDPSKIEIVVSIKIVGYGDNSLSFLPFGDGV